MNDTLKKVLRYPYYFFTYYIPNYIINYLPCWLIRKSYLKAIGMRIGCHSTINMGQKIINPDGISIGSTSHINSECILDGRGHIIIGNNVSISFRTCLITGSHNINSSVFSYSKKKIIIKDYAWIGVNATVLPGVTIGYGSVVAAGAIVTKDVPDMTIVAGIPATIIGHRKIKDKFSYNCLWTVPFA